MKNYELAFRMQMQVPDIVNIDDETDKIKEMYGVGKEPTDNFARRCLLARKLVEKGVRFVQLYASTWDSHDYIAKAHASRIHNVDQPITALIKDLKQRGLLDETLVVWMGEFGRTPDNGIRGGIKYGRDHNPEGFTMWMAGAGSKPGAYGKTDDIGYYIAENPVGIRDLQATILHQLGLNPHRFHFPYQGLQQRLIGPTEEGKVIKGIIS